LHWPGLCENGVVTASTCDPGLVYPETAKRAIPRITDTLHMTDIEVEAEMLGFSDLRRRAAAACGFRRS
jgi:hypothetical protein